MWRKIATLALTLVIPGLAGCDRGTAEEARVPRAQPAVAPAPAATAPVASADQGPLVIFLGDSLTAGTSVMLDKFIGQPRFAKARSQDTLFTAMRSTSMASRLLVRSYQGPDLTSPTVVATITDCVGNDVGGFTLAECGQGGVVTDVVGAKLFAFHLVSGTQHPVDLTNPGGPVYTEPFAPSVIALDPSTAPGARAFEVSKSGTMNIAINERLIWVPNGAYIPLTGATRRAETFKCP